MVALFIPNIPTLEYLDIGDTDQTADVIDNIFLNLWWSNIKVLNLSRAVPCQPYVCYDSNDLADSIHNLLRVSLIKVSNKFKFLFLI